MSFAIVRSAILSSGRLPVKIVERGKRKAESGKRQLKKVASVTKHGFVF